MDKKLLIPESERSTIFAKASQEGIVISQKGIILDANDHFTKMLGYSRAELVNKPIIDLVAPEWQELVKEKSSNGETEFYEHMALRKNGSSFQVRVRGSYLNIGGNKLRVTVVQDISERRKNEEVHRTKDLQKEIEDRKGAEQALRISEENLKRAQEVGQMGSWHIDLKTKSVSWSDETYRIFGISDGSPVNQEFFMEIIHEEDRGWVKDAYRQALTRRSLDAEYRVRIKEKTIWVRVKAKVSVNHSGRPVSLTGVVQDISKRKASEYELLSRTRDAQLINELNEAANQGTELNDLLIRASKLTKEEFNGYGSSFYLVDDSKQNLKLVATDIFQRIGPILKVLTGSPTPQIIIPLEFDNVYNRIFKSGKGRLLEGKDQMLQVVDGFLEMLSSTFGLSKLNVKRIRIPLFNVVNINALYLIPLALNQEIIGMMEISTKHNFSESDLSRIQQLATQITAIIHRKQAESSIRMNQENLSALIENKESSIWSVDRVFRLQTINSYCKEQFLTRFGQNLEPGDLILDKLPEYLRNTWIERYNRALKGERYTVEECYEMDHNQKYIEISFNPIMHSNKAVGVSVFSSDITPIKIAELIARENTDRIRAFANALPDQAFIIDQDGRYVEVLTSPGELLPDRPDNLKGKLLHDVAPREMADSFMNLISKTIKSSQPQLFEYELSLSNRLRWFEGRTAPVDKSGDQKNLVILIIRDITDRKNAESKLNQAFKELERSNSDLESFAYVASHDLQEPLRKIKSFTELIKMKFEGNIDEKIEKHFNYVSDGVTRMQMLITDLLAFSRITTRSRELEATSMEKVLKQAIENLEISIQESGAKIVSDPLPVIPVDASQMVQVFQNLVSNSLKFTKEGHQPQIQIKSRDLGDHHEISVSDNGIGMDMEYTGKIFEVFQRLNNRQKFEGTGIGLSLCKKIIERHGGSIRVHSEIDKGSIFYFTLPRN